MATGAMTVTEREAFLADLHVGVLAVDEPGRGPAALPIWYVFVDGVVTISIDGNSLKARLLERAGRATLTVQTEAAPYRYVCVEGPVHLERAHGDALMMATRYLGTEIGAWYVEQNPPNELTTLVHLAPEHWRTMDFAKLLEG